MSIPHLLEYNFTPTICATNDDIIGLHQDERKEKHKKAVADSQAMATTSPSHAVLDCQVTHRVQECHELAMLGLN